MALRPIAPTFRRVSQGSVSRPVPQPKPRLTPSPLGVLGRGRTPKAPRRPAGTI